MVHINSFLEIVKCVAQGDYDSLKTLVILFTGTNTVWLVDVRLTLAL